MTSLYSPQQNLIFVSTVTSLHQVGLTRLTFPQAGRVTPVREKSHPGSVMPT